MHSGLSILTPRLSHRGPNSHAYNLLARQRIVVLVNGRYTQRAASNYRVRYRPGVDDLSTTFQLLSILIPDKYGSRQC